MPINDALLNVGAAAMATAAAYAAIHTATPNSSGSNESSADRLEIDWAEPSGGDMTLASPLEFTGGEASGDAPCVGFWSASTGGTFYGYVPITSGDTSFNAAGEITVTSITLPGSAS